MQNRSQEIVQRLKAQPTQTRQALAQLDRFASTFYTAVEEALLDLILEDVPGIDLPVQEQTDNGQRRLYFEWGDLGVALVPCKHVVFPALDRVPDLQADCAVAGKLLALVYPLHQPDRRQVLSRFYVFPDGRWQTGGSGQSLPLDAAAVEAGTVPFLKQVMGQVSPS